MEQTPPSESSAPNPDAELLAACGDALVEVARVAVPNWVTRTLEAHLSSAGVDTSGGAWNERIEAASEATGTEVLTRLRALLARDLDDQRMTPLQILREATGHASQVLREAGVAPSVRDEWERRAFPDDDYRLAPASLIDVDEALHEPGLLWGAAKAHAVLARRRAEGRI